MFYFKEDNLLINLNMPNPSSQLLDIVDFLSRKENKFLLDNTLESKIRKRLLILQYFLKQKISITEAFWSFMPSAFRVKRYSNHWQDLYLKIVNDSLKFLLQDYLGEPINILGYKWYYLPPNRDINIEEYLLSYTLAALASLVEEIIIKDQYDAKEFLHSDDSKVILDCGANIGIFSLWAHYLSSESQIYSFEPTKSTFEILEKNIKINNLDGCILNYNMAVGNRIDRIQLRSGKDSIGADNSLIDSGLQISDKITIQNVQMVTLDNFVQENNLPRVDFIKIDTEGYEKQIIQGASETIKRFSPVIACSAYHFKNDKIEIPKLVKSINPNYHYKLLKRSEEDLIFWVNKTS